MLIDAQGLLIGGEYIPSPNCDDRPAGAIELLVIHNISLPPHGYGKYSDGEAVHARPPHPIAASCLRACLSESTRSQATHRQAPVCRAMPDGRQDDPGTGRHAGEVINESLREEYYDDEFGGDDVLHLFTNTLDAYAHPFYQTIAGLKVSAHFFIRRNGLIIQFVPCLKRAWHAGESCWQGRSRCNDFSLGIELEGSDTVPFADAQYDALHTLTVALRAAYPIRGIAGHSDIAPQRKTDPGPCFDWARYLAGLS